MSWKEKTISKILLLVAMILSNKEIREEIKALSNHISVYSKNIDE